jgi:ABC-type cobalamin/Fe3+-siderophores transport system ATPase subunit
MKEERRILQTKVFPRLEKFCEENGAKFQAVDLRWGVNEASQTDQKAMKICLNEIARCQKISSKPNFIALLGDKYGWQPVPERIPSTEMKQIFEILKQYPEDEIEVENKKIRVIDFVNRWYKEDENADPFEYVLQPREPVDEIPNETKDEYKDRKSNYWKIKEEPLRKILRNAVNKANPKFTEEQKRKYFYSATHQEILKGILNPSKDNEITNEHALLYIRDIKDLPHDNTANGYIDLIDNKQNDDCRQQLEGLKAVLKKKLDKHYTYQAEWENGNLVLNDSDAFADRVYNDLITIIENQITEIISSDEIEHEIKLHKEFKEKLTEHFCGREDILKDIKSYINNTSDNKILPIIGDSGTGKSSLMAQAIKLAEIDKKNAFIIYRFIGVTSRSSNILSFLSNLCGQIAKEFGVTLESLAGEGREKTMHEIQGLTEIFAKCLALGNANKPIILFLDALDQLSDTENAKSLYWLPKELPANAKIIVTSLPDLEEKIKNSNKKDLLELTREEAMQILEVWLVASKRDLQTPQKEELLSKFENGKPAIYLKLAFERARHWHSYDTAFKLQPDVKGIIEDFFTYLETEHTKEFVMNAICYMLCGRYEGLTENEILEILVFDKEYWVTFIEKTHKDHRKDLEDLKKYMEEELKRAMKIPIVVWSRLFFDMEPFLTERDADGASIISFFHRSFVDVLKEKYKLVEKVVKN